MAISPLSTSFNLIQETGKLRDQLGGLQLQLASGRKTTTYAGLGLDRTMAISLRAKISSIDAYSSTIQKTQIRVDLLQTHLSRVNEIANTTKSSAFGDQYELIENGKTQLQLAAKSNLDEVVSLLNFELSGSHYFSGSKTDTAPVVSTSEILDGIGTKAGFKQILGERNQADLGASGLGRVTIGNSTSDSVQLTEDGVHPFGMKLDAISSSTGNVSVVGPSGSPAEVEVVFSSVLPVNLDTINFTFKLPDGTTKELTLTATSTTPGDKEFAIGATQAQTRANFQAVLNTEIAELAKTALQAASSAQAGEEFFDFDDDNPPQRISGPPFDSATALVDATENDTVFWYQGDNRVGSARESAAVQIDRSITFSYGARANEDGLRTVVQNLALLASESFNVTDDSEQIRYSEMRNRVSSDLAFKPPNHSVIQIIAEFGQKQGVLGQVNERHIATKNTSGEILGDIENADAFEVSAQILQLQTRLEASFQISSRISQLSLLQYL